MTLGFRAIATLWLFIGLTACSDSKENHAKGVASNKNVDSGYHVIETFGVGDSTYVRSLAIDSTANTLWVGTSVGAVEVDLSTREMRQTFTRDNGLANEYVFTIMVDSEGGKWLGTNGGGVSHFSHNVWKTYFPLHGLADYWVYSFTEQANGTIWIGTWAGLNAFNPKTNAFKTYVKELVNEWVYGLAVDSKDRVWIGTEGGINMFDGITWKTWTHKEGLGAPNTEGLPVSPNTGLGTRSRHDLSVMLQGKPTYNPNYTFTLVVAADDSVWAGTWGGGVGHFDGSQWVNYTTKDGLAGNIVYSIAIDGKGILWFGTNRGLSRFDGKNWQTFQKDNGLLDDNIYAIAVASDGGIWVGSRGGVVLLGR